MTTTSVPSSRHRARLLSRWPMVIAGSALAMVLVACGSSDSKADQPATTASTASAASAAPIANAVTIKTPGMKFEVSGKLRPGVGAITFANPDSVSHMLAMARLKDGVTLEQVKAALTPHWKMGMVGELDVAGTPATEKPKSDGTITIDDKGIAMPDGFSGTGTFLVTNSGTTQHSISFARLDPGTTLATYAGSVGQAEGAGKSIDVKGGVLVGGVDALNAGQSAYVTLDLRTGHYGYISTTDAQGPALPPQHGEFDVS